MAASNESPASRQHVSEPHIPAETLGLIPVDKDDASDCGTEYPESDVSLGDCLPYPDALEAPPETVNRAAFREEASKQPEEHQTADVRHQQANICDELPLEAAHEDEGKQLASEQNEQQGGKSISQAPKAVPFTETQYPDVEDSLAEDFNKPAVDTDSLDQPKQSHVREGSPPGARSHSNASIAASDQPIQQAEITSGTQYPDWEDYELEEAHAAASPQPPAPCQDVREDAPAATQYPDFEEDDPLGQNALAQALQEAPNSVARELRIEGDEDALPAATQYPDLDEEEENHSQGQSHEHAGAAVESQMEEDNAPDAHSDFEAELDDFLAEQVNSTCLWCMQYC